MIPAATLFSVLNTLTLLSWILLVAAPRAGLTRILIRNYLIPGILAAFYTLVILFKFTQLDGGFSTLQEVQLLLGHPWGATAGWIHYLAFDLFVGTWIVSRAETHQVSHVFVAPLLIATFLLGPIGFLGYLLTEKVLFASTPFPQYLREKWRTWNRKNALLTQTSLALFALSAVCLSASLFDTRTLDGAPIWIKPAKFFASLGIYQLTIAWFLGTLPKLSQKYISRFERWTLLVSAVEMIIICGQAFLGVRSHYNNASVFDQLLYGVMGFFIVANVGVVANLMWHWIRGRSKLPAALWLGGVYGLALFLFACVLGMVMSAQPFSRIGFDNPALATPGFGWSGSAGDLRISHFIGLHALQVFPLFGWYLAREKRKTLPLSITAVVAGLLVLGLFALAFSGRPILAP